MSTILLSIKPEYAKKIIDGTKKYEFRKRLAKHPVTKIIIYSTFPGQIKVLTAPPGGRKKDSPKRQSRDIMLVTTRT